MSNPAAKDPSRTARLVAAMACGVAALALFQFFGSAARGYVKTDSLFWWWISQWLDPNADTEHGWLILGLSAWLLWRNLRKPETGNRIPETAGTELCAAGVSGFRFPVSGFAALLGGLALHAVGFAAQQARISIGALLLFTWGAVRLGGGRRAGAAAAFPLAFMLFAIPLNALDSIGFWLRMWVVDASGAIARAAGIPVLQSGTQLLAPDGKYNYDVAAACSGIRSLTAMAALSLLAGYLNFRAWTRRALILLLCFPLVYVGNVARILAIVFAAHWGGQKWGDRAHEIMGFGVFVIVLGGVLVAVNAMRRWWPEREGIADSGLRIADSAQPKTTEKPETGDRKPETRSSAVSPQWRNARSVSEFPVSGFRSPVFLAAAIVVVAALGEMAFLRHLRDLPPRGEAGVLLAADTVNPVELPAFLGIEWTGQPAAVSAVEREILPPDTGFSRKVYFNHRDPAKQVLLSIVLSGRDRTSIHRPELCLVGQGWSVVDSTEHVFRYPQRADAAFPARLLRVRREVATANGKAVVPQLVAYWFVSGEAVVSTHAGMFLRDAWNRVARARADRWAYVLMQTDAADGEEAALARMQAVLDQTLPAFQRPVATR